MKKRYEKPEMIEHGKLSELTQVIGPSPGDNDLNQISDGSID